MAKKTVKKKAASKAGSAKSKAGSEMKKFEAKAKKEIASAKKKLVAAEKKVEAYVRKNPKKAALIAAGVAAAIGIAVARHMKKKK